MMLYPRLTAALFLGAALVLTTSCSDPASVGTGIGPDSLSGGAPKKVSVVPTTIETTVVPSATGYAPAITLPESRQRDWRFLAGSVQDDLGGENYTVTADGYVDFLGTEERPTSFTNTVPDSLKASLRLSPTYFHGDTTSTLTLELYDLSREANMQRARADTTFEAEAQPIRSYTVEAESTLVRLPLPESWIEEHRLAILNEDTFEGTSFDGFKLAASSGNVVVGFDQQSATLRVRTSADTVDFASFQSFTHVERSGPPTLPDDRILLQDGVGANLSMTWARGSRIDSLAQANVLLNRAEITVPVDTVASQANRSNTFVRPLPSGYRILAQRVEGGPTCSQLSLFQLTAAGETCVLPTIPEWVPDEARVVSARSFAILDRWFFDERPLSTFRLEIANREFANPSEQQTVQRGLPSTVPAIVRPSAPNLDNRPRVILTVTPL